MKFFSSTNAAVVLPLPKGEGWGEGEGIVRQPIVHPPASALILNHP